MIRPSIGRIVLVYRGGEHIGRQWNAAQIIEVMSDTEISVAGFDRNGNTFRHLHITLDQDDVAKDPTDLPEQLDSPTPFACWMPYQWRQAQSFQSR